jgi:hypothetical protein
MSDSELEQLEQWLDEAGTQMIDGDWSLWQDKLSKREDVTLLGAYGAHVTGWADVQARFERPQHAPDDRQLERLRPGVHSRHRAARDQA